jgi:hypothetical protein
MAMNICANCGVELEHDMDMCPLCGTPAGEPARKSRIDEPVDKAHFKGWKLAEPEGISVLQRILWQVTSILLLSGIASTLAIDLAVHKMITWSVYPVTLCMIVFCYASFFAFWRARKIYQIIGGLLISVALFIVLDIALSQRWPLQLGLPLLCAVNFVAIMMMLAVNKAKQRGLNVIAYACVAIAVLCISIEGILSLYDGNLVLRWSVIVAACMLPVTAALLFMHHKIRKNPDMEKIFHT